MDTILTESPHRRKSNRKSWIDQSPIDPVTDIAREETLLLTHFTKKPTICFGKVKIGKTLHRKLYASNPHEYDQCVLIEKFPHEVNFTVDQKEFVVPGESTLTLNLTWTPENEGGCRQMISFLVDDSYRLQAVLYGTAELPRQKKVARRGIMSKSVKKPFSVLHTPNLANLKTYNTSMERETVSETSNVRRALLSSKSKSNQENRQPVTKKSSLATVKSPPRVQNGNSKNQNPSEEFVNWGESKSAHLETKVKSNVKELHHISRPKDTGTEIVSCVSYEDTTEQVTKTNVLKVSQWKALEKTCQIESMDNVGEMQTFDYALCKKQKQSHKQSVAALYPRRETYLVKKHMSQQRRNWKNWNLSPSAQTAISDRVNVTQPCLSSLTADADELAKTASATPVFTTSPNFMTSSPIENLEKLRKKIVQSEESSKRTGLSLNHNDLSASNSRERLGKIESSPKSDDGMSTDSLNSKNSSASSVEALLPGKGDPAQEKALEASTTLTFDFRKATPSLPEKLNPRNNQRSTHVVKEPKIVCGQGKLKQKQLFSTGHASPSCHDLSYIRPIDDMKVPPGPPKSQTKKPPTGRNSVSSRVRAAQKALRVTNQEQLSQSVHERLSRSQKSTASEKSKSILTQSARSTVRSVKKTEISKSRKSYLSPKKCGVAQSRLVLGKREKTVVPKHPMPFASKNIYYDERWMQKQEWSFTHWFNFILTPVEDYKLRNCPRVDAGSLVFNCKQDYHLAPSKEVLSFEAYAARRRLNRLRKLACQMFQSADIVRIVRKVEVEIDSQRLIVRKDRPIHADIGLKQNILNWILSYNPLWLRIGLEMVFGEVLLIESNTDILGLSKFIITRLVGNPDIASQFAHPTVPHLYRDGYQTALAKHTLKKFLILVYFLDYAKRHRLIEHDPCLFCKDSEIKASRDFLLNISRDFLSGEGDVTRHLAYLGYVVSYVQTPLDEFDYAVTNLAVDLRDGVRLTRVIEILTGKWRLTKSLRAPAISRLQKIHNVEMVLKALSDHGMSLNTEKGEICAKDIVDGHREKSLTLLWRIVTGFQVDILLDMKELEDEIACLNRSLKRKMAIWKSAGVKSTFELNNRRSSVDLRKFENFKHGLLFDWCQAVCSHYGLKIENFTVSFSDGRVLCYLIHHYYPGLLPLSEIKQETTFTYINECENQQEDSDNSFDLMASSLHCCPRTGKPKIYQELLANEVENFKLIAVKVSQIGGVPTMLRHSDMSNTIPDEKVVITYVTYLAIRLLEIRHESRAAIIIQLAWRKYQLRKKLMLLKVKNNGPTLIPDNAQILQPQSQTPDQSSPKQESISIKNAYIPLSENSNSLNLGHSINDYSPIRPVEREPLPVSSKKSKVLDPILESSTIESCINYTCGPQVVAEPFLAGDENISPVNQLTDHTEAGDEDGVSQRLNKTINLSDNSLIRSDDRSAANLRGSSRTGDVSLNRPCSDSSAKRAVDNFTDSKGASSQLNTTMDLKDRSPLLRCDLPEVYIDLCNETFNSDNCNQRSETQPAIQTSDNSLVGINQTFDSEGCVQKFTPLSNIPEVDAKQLQNETFEKICSQRCAPNSALRNRNQNSRNETFNETSLPPESDLLSSPVTKVGYDDAQGNVTFDGELSKPELQDILPGSRGYAVQGNKMTLALSDSENSNIPDFEDRINANGTSEGEVQNLNSKMGLAEFERSHHQIDESHPKENDQENESRCGVDEEDQCLRRQHSQNKQISRSFVCEETMERLPVLNQTVEIDSRCQGSFSEGPAAVAMSFDHARLNGIVEPQPSEIEDKIFDSHEKDNRINLEFNKTAEYESEEAVKLQSGAAADLQSWDTSQFEAQDPLQSDDAVELMSKEALQSGDGKEYEEALQSGDAVELQDEEALQSGDAVELQDEEALQSGDAVELQDEEALQSGDAVELQDEEALQSGDAVELQDEEALQSGDGVELQSEEALQSGEVSELQSGDVASLQSEEVLQARKAAELQSGDAVELQSGDSVELQSEDAVELQSEEALQSGDATELQSGDAVELQFEVASEVQAEEALQYGDAVELQSKEALQFGDVANLQCKEVLLSGDAAELQSESELLSGDAAELQSESKLLSGDAAELQFEEALPSGDGVKLQSEESGDAAELQSESELLSGDAAELQFESKLLSGDAAELQSELELLSGDAAELQFEEALPFGDGVKLQSEESGDAAELQSESELLSGDAAELQSESELLSGDAAELQSESELLSGDAVELQFEEALPSGDGVKLQSEESGDAAELQSESGDAAELQSESGDAAELQSESGDAAELQSESGDAAELQSESELLSGDAVELQFEEALPSGDGVKLQSEESGDAAELQSESGDAAELQSESGDAAELQSESGDAAELQSESGDAAELQSESGDAAELQSESGDAAELQFEEALPSGDGVKLQSEEELHSGDVAELPSDDLAELQSREDLQCDDVAELQSKESNELCSQDLFNDSYVCQVHNDSVSFSKMNKTLEIENSYDGSTAVSLQNSEDINHVGSCSNIPDTVDSLQNSPSGIVDESKCGDVISDSQLQQSSFEESEEEWIEEEFILKMSRARTKEMIVDRESPDPSAKQKDFLTNKAALVIQKAFHRYATRKHFLHLKNSAIAIQRWYRYIRKMKKAQQDFQDTKAATLVIQSAIRAHLIRKKFIMQKRCLITLQQRRKGLVLMRNARTEYLAKRAAIKSIQRWYRAVKEMRKVKINYEHTRNAAIKIQRWHRAIREVRKAKTDYENTRTAALKIQRWHRAIRQMRKAKTDYENTRNAALKIQRWHRAVTEMKKTKTDYENTRNAALKIQRWHRAVTEMKKTKTDYENTRNAALKIQRWHRAVTEMKKTKTDYENTRNAALKIQRWHRAIREMRKARTNYENTRMAAIKIQRWRHAITEMRKAKNDFENTRNAAIKIQRWHRSTTEMKKAKTDYENTRKAVIKIQSLVRRRNQRREFLRRKNAFLCIQKWFRSVLRMKEERHKYVSLKNAAIRIQANFHGYKQRKAYLLQQESALRIQSLFRKFLARKRFLHYRNSAITIQQHYRSTMAMRKARKDFESLKAAALVIQSTVKAYQARKRFLQKKKCVLFLQERRRAIVSMRIARTEYLARKGASKLIQRWYRGVMEMRKVRGDFVKTRNAAVKLQSLVRMRNQRKEFLRKKASAVCIQKWYQSVQMTQEVRANYISVRRAAIQIQALFRAHRQRKRFLLEKESALRIQEWYRCTCRMRQARIEFLCVKSSTIKIQRAYKAYCLMRAAKESYLRVRSSVIKCQSQARMLLARRKFLEQKRCTIVIQKWYCSRKLMQKEMSAYQSKKLAVVKLQSAFRSYSQRKIYLHKRRCIISAQSVVRMWIARRRLLSMQRAAILIQRKYRSRLALRRLREMIMKRHEAATRIQLWFRKQLILRRQRGVLKINCDCCSAESLTKNKKFADIWLGKLQRKLNAVCLLQKYWRAWLCRKHSAIKIQRVYRGWLVRRWLAQQTSAAVRIQSFWRGYKVRCTARRHVTDLRKRLEDVTKKATDDKKLSNRFASGFNHLMKYKQISEILQALVNLEVASRLSPVCCVQLAEGNAAPVILTIIRGCNRSIPHIEIIKYCIQILLNLAKYAPTIEAVYDSHPDAIDIIMNVLMVFREKGLVFAKSCILLGIIALDMQEKGELDMLLTKPQLKEKILSLYKLTSRKYKMGETRVTTRARMMAVKDSAVFREISTTADMAKIGPDWLLGKKILREIEEPLKAMTYLLNCLGLQHFVNNTQSKLPGKTHK